LAVPRQDFPGCSVWFKSALRDNLCVFCAPNILAVVMLARNNHNYPSVAPMSQSSFWSHGP
jgi:hypothetical protein